MKPPRISEAEWDVMKVVWRLAPCQAAEVARALRAHRKWSVATVKTFLNRLLAKGALRFEKKGRAYLYSPLHSEEDLRGAESESFLRRVFDGALSPMLAHFVHARRLTPKDWDMLERIVRERRKSP